MSEREKPKGRQGFASMDPERVKAIAAQGGQALHRLGLAHQWTAQTASEAGRKGGRNRWKSRRQPAA